MTQTTSPDEWPAAWHRAVALESGRPLKFTQENPMNATPQTNADHDSVPVADAPRNLAEGSPSPHDLVMGQPAARERITALDAAARLAIAEETPVVRDPKATH